MLEFPVNFYPITLEFHFKISFGFSSSGLFHWIPLLRLSAAPRIVPAQPRLPLTLVPPRAVAWRS